MLYGGFVRFKWLSACFKRRRSRLVRCISPGRRSSVEERWWFRQRLFGLMSSVGTSFAARQFRRCFQAVTVEWRRKRCVSLRRS
ncbi:hypothetical protein F2Q69_00057145 [Brassica cretica]|uniref:Uncharacterized protein n=1 Tax=Brassica cretica TaxID=69181 RepID=A0A8S9N6N8_BRACR|nr:hypothetical protein F2Q69_00057145 [Brassica cretica]